MKQLFTVMLLFLAVCLFAGEYVISDFSDTDISAFTKAGDSNYLSDYSLSIANEGSYCLRLDKKTDKGWFGVNYPEMKKLPISDIQGFALDAKEGINCPEISFTVFLADKSRWNCVININSEWKHFDLIKESFFAEENPNSLPNIDFSQIEWIWISLRPGDNSQKSTLFLDNLKIYCNAEETDLRESITIDKTANLKGVKVWVIDTDTLPLLGQSEGAVEIITSAMKKAGAKVTVCKDMKKLAATPDTVIVYESPVVNEEDFPYLEKALKKGARLVWLGVDVPFSRVVKNGEMTKQEQVYTSFSYRLTKGAFQAFDPVTNKNPFILTEAGKKALKEFPEEFQGTKCNYLTIDDSIWLNQNYPWVEYIPLVKTDYRATNWVFLDRPFQGSVISEFVHHAGKFAGSVMIFASMSPSGSSILNPRGGAYAYLVSSLVKEASKKVVIDKNIDKIPPEPFRVTRENFFYNDFKILGGLNFNGCDLSDPDNIYALKRMGYNCLLIGIPWTVEKNSEGYYIDFEKCDKWIKDAEKIGLGIIFDPYPFGWTRFPWANVHNGKQSGAMYIFNDTFRDLFAEQMKALCERYKNSPALLAVYATPDTGAMGFAYPDESEVTKDAWAEYAKAHGLNEALPTHPTEKGVYATTPENEGWVDFWYETMDKFMTQSVETIRGVIPELPILLRGSYLDAAQGFKFAERYKDMGPYCECIETSVDVDAYYRGLSMTYDTTIGGENGWPKERGLPLRMAMADVLLGGYKYYLFSFEAVPYAEPGVLEYDTLNKVWGNIINSDRIKGNTALLISDSTIWTSSNGNFFEMEGRPNNVYIMEKMGVGFGAVSAHFMDNINKYKVIIDNGGNDVFTAQSREKLINWIKDGGTFLCYDFTGRLDMSGKDESFAGDLGISLVPGVYTVGKGKIIVMDKIATDDKDYEYLKEYLAEAGCEFTVSQDVPISSTAYTRDGNIFYVYYNKSRDLVGSFFSEERRPATEAALTDTAVNISVPAGKTKATELISGKDMKISDGKVILTVPAGSYSVVKFE